MRRLSILLAFALASTVTAQTTRSIGTAPAGPSERTTVWGGVNTELLIVPGLKLGLSVPVGQAGGLNLAVRGSAGVLVLPLPGDSVDGDGNIGGAVLPVPLFTADLDLLLRSARPGAHFYGGPSVGTVMGQVWLLGAVAGYENTFGRSNWGYFVEAKLRAAVGGADLTGVSPGVNLGLTYRF